MLLFLAPPRSEQDDAQEEWSPALAVATSEQIVVCWLGQTGWPWSGWLQKDRRRKGKQLTAENQLQQESVWDRRRRRASFASIGNKCKKGKQVMTRLRL